EAKRWAETAQRSLGGGIPELVEPVRLMVSMNLARVALAEGRGTDALQHLKEGQEALARFQEMARLQQAPRGKLRETRPSAKSEARDQSDPLERAKLAWLFGQAYALAERSEEATAKFLEAVEVIE